MHSEVEQASLSSIILCFHYIIMLAFESLDILSAIPKDLIGVFFILNLCACLVIFVSKRWASGATARPSSPDLEKPAVGLRGKVTRPPGGMYPEAGRSTQYH